MARREVATVQLGGITIGRDEYGADTCGPINEGLGYFNGSIIGPVEHHPLVITARDADGAIVGGIIGDVFVEWLHIEVLWVAEPSRLRGVGTSLLSTIEAEACKLGARRAYVDTVAYQAPGFYVKLGYTEFGRNRNFVRGHDRIFLEKSLVEPSAASDGHACADML